MSDETFEAIKAFLIDRQGEQVREKITPESFLRKTPQDRENHPDAPDLGLDSLEMVELLMELEDKFGTEIKDEEAQKLKTIADAVEYIRTHPK